MNVFRILYLFALLPTGCMIINKEPAATSACSFDNKVEIWSIEMDAITVYPNANWYATKEEEAMNPIESEIITLFHPREKIQSVELDQNLDSIYRSSTSPSKGRHYDPYISHPPVVKFGVRDKRTSSWYLVIMDNVTKDRFLICACNKNNLPAPSIPSLAGIPPFKESQNPAMIKIILSILSEYENNPKLMHSQW